MLDQLENQSNEKAQIRAVLMSAIHFMDTL